MLRNVRRFALMSATTVLLAAQPFPQDRQARSPYHQLIENPGGDPPGCAARAFYEEDRPVLGRRLCVRTCDGFFFPLPSSPRDSRAAAQMCQAHMSSAAPTACVLQAQGGQIEFLLGGRQPYSLARQRAHYRTNLDETCASDAVGTPVLDALAQPETMIGGGGEIVTPERARELSEPPATHPRRVPRRPIGPVVSVPFSRASRVGMARGRKPCRRASRRVRFVAPEVDPSCAVRSGCDGDQARAPRTEPTALSRPIQRHGGRRARGRVRGNKVISLRAGPWTSALYLAPVIAVDASVQVLPGCRLPQGSGGQTATARRRSQRRRSRCRSGRRPSPTSRAPRPVGEIAGRRASQKFARALTRQRPRAARPPAAWGSSCIDRALRAASSLSRTSPAPGRIGRNRPAPRARPGRHRAHRASGRPTYTAERGHPPAAEAPPRAGPPSRGAPGAWQPLHARGGEQIVVPKAGAHGPAPRRLHLHAALVTGLAADQVGDGERRVVADGRSV